MRSAIAAMRAILLDVHLEAHAARRIGMLRERADARAQLHAALKAPRQRRVLAPRHIAEHASAPEHTHRVRVVRVLGLARELERIANAQRRPHFSGSVIAKAGQRRVLDQKADARLRMGRLPYEQRESRYSPKASRIHWTLSPSTRKTSKRQEASG